MQKTYPLETFNGGAVDGHAFARECELSGLVPVVHGVSTSSGDPERADTATIHLEGDELSAAQLVALDALVGVHVAPPPVVFDPLAEAEPAVQRADVQQIVDDAIDQALSRVALESETGGPGAGGAGGGPLGLTLTYPRERLLLYACLAAVAGLAVAQLF